MRLFNVVTGPTGRAYRPLATRDTHSLTKNALLGTTSQKFIELGADPQFGSPAEFAAYVADDFAKWARLAKEAGLKAE